MLKLLLKKQISEIFRNYLYNAKKNCARSKAGMIGYILLFVIIMAGLLGGMFTMLSLSICEPLAAAGMDWLYYVLMGLLSILLGTFGSVFNTYSCLYLAKDNDLMLSLPIPVKVLMASRLAAVYLMGLMYSIVVILPAVVVYWVEVSISVQTFFGGLLLVLLISMIVLFMSCVLGWAVAKISLRLKYKSLITVLASLAFIGGYYFFYFKAQTIIQELIINASEYGTKIKDSAYPLYLFGSVGTGDAAAMLIVSAVVLALLALIWTVISGSFLKIATSTGKTGKRVYKETAVRQKSCFAALLGKEFKRFLASPVYMLNCGLGILMLPVCGVLLLWRGGEMISILNAAFGAKAGCTPILLCAMVCLLASMNDMAAPSVSLEGKSLWIVQSLPVKPLQVLQAKLSVQLILTGIPVLFCIGCLAFVYPYTAAELLLTAVVLLSYVMLSALFSLFLGVLTANLTWTNEMIPVKQNMGVVFAMLSGFAYAILFCVGFMLLNGWKLGVAGYMALAGAVTIVLCVLFGFWLSKKGSRRLEWM